MLADLRGRIDMVIDAGPCPVGVESTIVACLDEPTLLRPGGLPREEIERVLGRALAVAAVTEDAPLAPGMLSSHYAPKAQAAARRRGGARPDEALLAFGPAVAALRSICRRAAI